MFIDNVYQQINQKHNVKFGFLTIADVRIGAFLAGLKLSDGSYGIASAIPDTDIHCDKKHRNFGAFTPMQIVGRTVDELFKHQKQTATVQMLKIASLNAFFHTLINTGPYNIIRNTDPVDTLKLSDYKNIAMVGAFHSYINKISVHDVNLKVLELNKEAFLPHHKQYYVPAEHYKTVFPQSDLIIITGLTLVNNTFDDLLTFMPKSAKIILIGPSASIPPDLYFEKGIDLIGGTLITNQDNVFPLISQGAASYHLFEYCAEKIVIAHD